MSATSGEKRRRRRVRRFLQLHDVLSTRASVLATVAAFGFLAWQAARTLFPV